MRGISRGALLRSHLSHAQSLRFPAFQQPNYSTASQSESTTSQLSPRWLSDVKTRIGKCIIFGLEPAQVSEAGMIVQEISRDWRDLFAGGEGFLTNPHRRSVFRREIVWGEMDSMGHVNNVMYNRFAEAGRMEWARKFANHNDRENGQAWRDMSTPNGLGLILRTITTDFKFPMKWPDHVTVYHKLKFRPDETMDAFTLEALIISELHQRPAARCVEDLVVYDYRIGKKARLPMYMVKALRKTWDLQEQAKQENGERVRSLLHRVRRLEQESWDRPGAVEK